MFALWKWFQDLELELCGTLWLCNAGKDFILVDKPTISNRPAKESCYEKRALLDISSTPKISVVKLSLASGMTA